MSRLAGRIRRLERAIPGDFEQELASLSDAVLERTIADLWIQIEGEIEPLSMKQIQAYVDEQTPDGPSGVTRQYVDELWKRWRKLREGISKPRNPSADYPL